MVVLPTAVGYLTTEVSVKLRRLDNIDVLCVDLDRMVPFYRDVIGLPFVLPYERAQGWAGFQAGDVTIYLIEIGAEPPRAARSRAPGPPGSSRSRSRSTTSTRRSPSSTRTASAGPPRSSSRSGTATAASTTPRATSCTSPCRIASPSASTRAMSEAGGCRGDRLRRPRERAVDRHARAVARPALARGRDDDAVPRADRHRLSAERRDVPAARPRRRRGRRVHRRAICARACSTRGMSRRRSCTAPTASRRSRTPTPPSRSPAPSTTGWSPSGSSPSRACAARSSCRARAAGRGRHGRPCGRAPRLRAGRRCRCARSRPTATASGGPCSRPSRATTSCWRCTSAARRATRRPRSAGRRPTSRSTSTWRAPFQAQLMSLVAEGAFDRFPTLRVICVESGFAWLPSLPVALRQGLARPAARDPVDATPAVGLRPRARPPDDAAGRRAVGRGRLRARARPARLGRAALFATDYPHWQADSAADARAAARRRAGPACDHGRERPQALPASRCHVTARDPLIDCDIHNALPDDDALRAVPAGASGASGARA